MMKNTFLFVGLILIPIILHSLFHKYWKKRWMRFSKIGVQHSTQAIKAFWGIPALVSVLSLIAIGLIILWYFVKPEFAVHWSGWVFASVIIFTRFIDVFAKTYSFFSTKMHLKLRRDFINMNPNFLKRQVNYTINATSVKKVDTVGKWY